MMMILMMQVDLVRYHLTITKIQELIYDNNWIMIEMVISSAVLEMIYDDDTYDASGFSTVHTLLSPKIQELYMMIDGYDSIWKLQVR